MFLMSQKPPKYQKILQHRKFQSCQNYQMYQKILQHRKFQSCQNYQNFQTNPKTRMYQKIPLELSLPTEKVS
jgi:hypothetical protein